MGQGTPMLQRTLPSLHDHDGVADAPPFGVPEIRREPPTPEGTFVPAPTPAGRSRLGLVLALVGTGLLVQGVADALARAGHESLARALFICALLVLFAPCAWRLTNAQATRRERVSVSLVLGLGLFASYVMHQPLQLDSFDELIHVGTLVQLLNSHSLFPTNSILPVSPYYPGLELATSATRWFTGLPLVVDELVVLAAVRVVLVLVVFLVVERACHSSRAAGIGVLAYAASPQFYGFDSQYAYETIALAFAVAVVYLVFVTVDAARPKIGRSFALALACVGAVVVSHHVTGWFTVAFLLVWTCGLYLTSHPLRHLKSLVAGPSDRVSPHPAFLENEVTVLPSSVSDGELRNKKRRLQAAVVGLAAAVGVLACAAWTAYVFRLLAPYLGPAFSAAGTDIAQALGNGHGNRPLFHNAAGGGSPGWEVALILASAIGWCVILVFSLYSVIFKRSVRGGALRFLPAAIAALYPISLLADVSSNSKLVADRATTFIFFGIALVVGAWLGRRIGRNRRMIERVGTIVVAVVVFLGSLVFGFGPLVSLLPGPYVVGADDLSYGSPSLALARWADTHIPAGSHIAADKDNSDLLIATADLVPVEGEDGLIDPELLFFDNSLSLYDIYTIRKDDIRYIVVDDRLAQGLPLYGTYIAAGEPARRLTLAELNKFDTYPFIKRVYDNGPIQVYDTTALLRPSTRAAPAGAPAGGTGLNVGVFALAAVVAVLWLLRLRRRSGPVHDVEHLVVCGVVGALVIGVFGAFLIRMTHVSPEVVAIVVLLLLLVLSLRPEKGHPRDWTLFRRTNRRPAPLETSTRLNRLPEMMANGASFYEQREVKDILAYLRVLADPGDEVSARRIVNVPKRGLGETSVYRLATWARENHVSLSEAIDRAAEAGLSGKALNGAEELSAALAELRPLVPKVNPADFVQLVADRTGYMAELATEHTREAAGRVENLAELATQAGHFDDVMGFLEAAARMENSDELDATATENGPSKNGRPDRALPTVAASRTRRSRPQVVLGCVGLALFALGATVATRAAFKDWTPPPELSITTSQTGHSVADVQLGSAGPIDARLEISTGGKTVWSSSLTRTTAAQSVELPASTIAKGSRVLLVAGDHTLRRVDA